MSDDRKGHAEPSTTLGSAVNGISDYGQFYAPLSIFDVITADLALREPAPTDFVGCKFAVNLALAQLIEALVDNPYALGLPKDLGIFDRTRFGPGSITQPPEKTPVTAIMANLRWHIRRIWNAESPASLAAALAGARTYAARLGDLLVATNEILLPESLSLERVQKDLMLNHLVVYFHNKTNVDWVGDRVFGEGNGRRRPAFGNPRAAPAGGDAAFAQGLLSGYKRAVGCVWNHLLPSKEPEIAAKLETISTWEDFDGEFGYFRDLGESAEIRNEPNAAQVRIRRSDPPPGWLLADLTAPAERSPPKEPTIAHIFENRPVRLLCSGDPFLGLSQFRVVLLGLAAQARNEEGERVHVLELRHLEGARNIFSYALYVPSSTGISNRSEYWVFHHFCSDRGSSMLNALKHVQRLLREHESLVEIKKYAVADEELRQFLNPDGLEYLTWKARSLQDHAVRLRGFFAELMVAELLRQEGWTITALDKKVASERIDVSARRPDRNEALVIEVKKSPQAIPVSELKMGEDLRQAGIPGDDEIVGWDTNEDARDLEKLDALAARGLRPADRKALGFSAGDQISFVACLTGEDITFDERFCPNLRIWRRKELLRRMARTEVPKAYRLLLESTAAIDPDAEKEALTGKRNPLRFDRDTRWREWQW